MSELSLRGGLAVGKDSVGNTQVMGVEQGALPAQKLLVNLLGHGCRALLGVSGIRRGKRFFFLAGILTRTQAKATLDTLQTVCFPWMGASIRRKEGHNIHLARSDVCYFNKVPVDVFFEILKCMLFALRMPPTGSWTHPVNIK